MSFTDSDALELRLEMEALICKREAMIVKNAQQHALGLPIIHSPDAFYDLGKQFEKLHTYQVTLIEG